MTSIIYDLVTDPFFKVELLKFVFHVTVSGEDKVRSKSAVNAMLG
jgi:hypothetical protein